MPDGPSVPAALIASSIVRPTQPGAAGVCWLRHVRDGLAQLERLLHIHESPVVSLYIAKALEWPGISYDRAPEFWGFELPFPKMRWPPGRYVDRLSFTAAQIGKFRLRRRVVDEGADPAILGSLMTDRSE